MLLEDRGQRPGPAAGERVAASSTAAVRRLLHPGRLHREQQDQRPVQLVDPGPQKELILEQIRQTSLAITTGQRKATGVQIVHSSLSDDSTKKILGAEHLDLRTADELGAKDSPTSEELGAEDSSTSGEHRIAGRTTEKLFLTLFSFGLVNPPTITIIAFFHDLLLALLLKQVSPCYYGFFYAVHFYLFVKRIIKYFGFNVNPLSPRLP